MMMNDLDFIKEFRKIQITKICEEVGVDYANLISGRSSQYATHKVKKELINKMVELIYNEKNKVNNNAKQNICY